MHSRTHKTHRHTNTHADSHQYDHTMSSVWDYYPVMSSYQTSLWESCQHHKSERIEYTATMLSSISGSQEQAL